MSIVASELIAYAAANMPTDESSTVGGAIDPLRRVTFTDIAATDTVQALSDSASDTAGPTVTVTGRNAGGATVSETKALTGTSAITFSTMGAVERVQIVELSATCVGNITVRRTTGATLIGTVPIGERGFRRMFINAFSDVGSKNYYEKFFWKNTNGSLALLNALVQQNSDPTGKVTHLIAAAVGDTATSANRLTAPSAANTLDPDTFDDVDKAVPGTDLASAAAIGVWLKLALGAADSPIKSSYTSQLSGQSV
jgi:hypothetical protein